MNAFNRQLNATISRMEKYELLALKSYLTKYPAVPAWHLNGKDIAPETILRWTREGKYPTTPEGLELCRINVTNQLNNIYIEEEAQAEREAITGRCMDCGRLLDECLCE